MLKNWTPDWELEPRSLLVMWKAREVHAFVMAISMEPSQALGMPSKMYKTWCIWGGSCLVWGMPIRPGVSYIYCHDLPKRVSEGARDCRN